MDAISILKEHSTKAFESKPDQLKIALLSAISFGRSIFLFSALSKKDEISLTSVESELGWLLQTTRQTFFSLYVLKKISLAFLI